MAENVAGLIAVHMPWEQQPGEPDLLYARFNKYLSAGPDRTLRAVYRQECAERGETPKANPSAYWYRAKKDWQWDQRVTAYELEQRRADLAAHEGDRIANRMVRRAKLTAALVSWEELYTTAKDLHTKRLLLETLTRLTAEARKEHGDDIQRIEELSARYDVVLPGVDNDNA